MKTNDNLTNLASAMFAPSFPCNPLPFLNGLAEGIKENGSDYIMTDEAKRMLFVVIAQSYGQLFNIDSLTEYQRLSKIHISQLPTDF